MVERIENGIVASLEQESGMGNLKTAAVADGQVARFDVQRWLLPALLFLGFLGLYLATLTRVHTFDALSYILDVDRKPWPELFHPHHLAYGPLGSLVKSIARGTGLTGSAALPLQLTNALAGALGVALCYRVTLRASGRADLALVAALLLGGSYAYWYYAVEVEVYTIAALFLLLALGLMPGLLQRPAPRRWLVLGLAQGLAVLFHQTNVLLGGPILLLWWLADWPEERRRRAMLWGGLAYALPLATIVGGAYLLVGFGVSGFRSWDELLAWMTQYARTGWWGAAPDVERLRDLGLGLQQSFARQGGWFFLLLMVVALVAAVWRMPIAQRRLAAVLGLWLLIYGGFFFWWEPDNIEFWIASMPPLLVLLALGLSGGRRWGVSVWPGLIAALLLLGMNYAAISRQGDATRDLQRLITTELAAQSVAGDLLLVPDGKQELYLPYYAGRDNVFSLNQALFVSAGDWPAACNLLRERIRLTQASGYAVLVAADVLQPQRNQSLGPVAGSQGRGGILERFGLEAAEVRACFAPFMAGLVPLAADEVLPPYYRLPGAQELAAGPGWDFRQGRWGWRALNVAEEELSVAGWRMRPATDPALISPPFTIDAADVDGIELELAADTVARDAQLFWLDGQGQTSEERSLRWTLEPGAEPQIYRLELVGQPGWSGLISGLRLDPVGMGDGGTVQIVRLRLLAGRP